MSDKFIVYQPDGDGCGDFVAFNGACGESILDETECVRILNGFSNACDKLTEKNKMLREALESLHNSGVNFFNGSYDGEEDGVSIESSFNDALIFAVESLEKAK